MYKFLNDLYDRVNQNYEENEKTIKPAGVHNASFCYNGKSPTNNDNEKNSTFYSIKKKNSKEVYTHELKSIGKKVSFAAVLTDFTRRWALPEEAKMTVIK